MTLRAVSSIGTSGGGIGLKSSGVLAQSGAASSITGSVALTPLASLIIPASAMGSNGKIRYSFRFTWTNNANNKTMSITIGGVTVYTRTRTTNNADAFVMELINRGVQNSQIETTLVASAGASYSGNASAAVTTFAIDTSVQQTMVFSAQLANAADTVTLEGYSVEILNP